MPNETLSTKTEVVDGIALTHVEPDGGASHANPIVFVHGGCHGAWCFAEWQGWFAARGWRNLALDWRSHGSSAPMEQQQWLKRPITAVAEDIEVAVARLAETTDTAPIVVGQSMGGLATLAYAATAGRSLAAIALMAPVLPGRFAPEPVDLAIDMDQPWGPPPLEVAHELFWPRVNQEVAKTYYARLQPESPTAAWQATRWTAEVDVAAVRAPALVVAVGDDVLAPADHVRALGRALGAYEIYREDAGHCLSLDPVWKEVAEQIEAWLLDVVTGPQL
ncbi:pimeloyl-ACP methyl ester carboxylesterase [Streptomyces achromogenes]|uniref:Pimeloyl-ACP methyl ester carboxylesterase n=1 Tax=Streptomyces achromogenes TaxID=67255 RepID=A0ABU0PVB0_STRAH|nr:alpha/beta fold hydrolase [Streptomyces achromogenes]MDQ0681896.1 pimeloyl-ACP methyl ester carboxylesterase [Streptomyces achromogenes]MDQ0829046.1 pimeloyl-ACP methyl ester carboxylesterase [Streptomyces achromogenes]